MKLIIAIVKPFKLDDVREALVSAGVEGLKTLVDQGANGRTALRPVVADGLAAEIVLLLALRGTRRPMGHVGSVNHEQSRVGCRRS